MGPGALLDRVYARGSLRNASDGVRFDIVNRLMNIERVALRRLAIDGTPEDMDRVRLELPGAEGAAPVAAGQPFRLPPDGRVGILLPGRELPKGAHRIEMCIEVSPFGEMEFKVDDTVADVPRGEPEGAEPRDTGESLYDTALQLLTSSMDAYIEAQNSLVQIAIQQAEREKIIGSRTAEVTRDVVTELTTSFGTLARKSAENLAAAGKLFLK